MTKDNILKYQRFFVLILLYSPTMISSNKPFKQKMGVGERGEITLKYKQSPEITHSQVNTFMFLSKEILLFPRKSLLLGIFSKSRTLGVNSETKENYFIPRPEHTWNLLCGWWLQKELQTNLRTPRLPRKEGWRQGWLEKQKRARDQSIGGRQTVSRWPLLFQNVQS